MSVSIATMGYYTPQSTTGGQPTIEYIETGSSDGWLETKRKPVAAVTFRKKRKKRIEVNVSLRNN